MPEPLFSRLRLAINAIPITASGKAASAQVIAPMPNADRAMLPTDALIALPEIENGDVDARSEGFTGTPPLPRSGRLFINPKFAGCGSLRVEDATRRMSRLALRLGTRINCKWHDEPYCRHKTPSDRFCHDVLANARMNPTRRTILIGTAVAAGCASVPAPARSRKRTAMQVQSWMALASVPGASWAVLDGEAEPISSAVGYAKVGKVRSRIYMSGSRAL